MPSLEIPKRIYEILESLAKRKGKTVEELLLEAVMEELDPGLRVEVYLKLHEKHLGEAEKLYKKGDLQQAGEKCWGAAATLLKAIAEKRGKSPLIRI